MIPGSKGWKSDASLLTWRFLILGTAKNMSKKPFFAEKWADCECFWGLWEHAVRSNPVSKGAKDLLTPTSWHWTNIPTGAEDSANPIHHTRSGPFRTRPPSTFSPRSWKNRKKQGRIESVTVQPWCIPRGVFAVFCENPELCGAKRRFFAVSVHHLLRFSRRLNCNEK